MSQSLSEIATDVSNDILALPALQRLAEGKMSRAHFLAFTVQRHIGAQHFVPLLKAGIAAATACGDDRLRATLEQNWRDETGRDENGIVNENNVHANWRRDYLLALGLTYPTRFRPWPETAAYSEAVHNLAKSKNALIIVGAVLLIERVIPDEFRCIAASRDTLFAELFANDRARLYLDDHIIHDARWHYPDLLGALKKYEGNVSAVGQIASGMWTIAAAKRTFYERVLIETS